MSNKNPKSVEYSDPVDLVHSQDRLTDVHDMAITIDHDVAVVPILDLENIASHGVCSHGLDEIQSSFLEGSSIWTAIFVDEITVKVVDLGTTHFVS